MIPSSRLSLIGLCSFAALLSACAPVPTSREPVDVMEAQSSAPIGATLNIRLEKKTTEDAQATLHTTASLVLTGAAQETVTLPDILGDLRFVSAASYLSLPGTDLVPVAVFTAWWAGEGEEIIVFRDTAKNALSIQHRYGGEQGECTQPEVIDVVAVPSDVIIELADMGEPLASSSLNWCEHPITK